MWGGGPVGSLASHMGLLQNNQAESPTLRIFLSGVECLVGILGRVVQCPCSLLTLTAPATERVVTCVSGFTLSEDWLSCNFGPFKFLCTSGTQVLVQSTALYLKTYPRGAFLCASTAPVSAELDHPTHSETGPGRVPWPCIFLLGIPRPRWPQLFCGIHPELLSMSCTSGSFWCSHLGAQRAVPRVPPPARSSWAKLSLWLHGALLWTTASDPGWSF